MLDLDEILGRLNIPESKRAEIQKKPQLQKNLEQVFGPRDSSNKLLYTLACTATRNIDLDLFADLIDSGAIRHEGMLKGCYRYAERSKGAREDELRKFISENDVGAEHISAFIDGLRRKGVHKKEMLNAVRNAMPCADFKVVVEAVGRIEEKDEDRHVGTESKGDWLEEGEIRKLHRPGEGAQPSEEVRMAHLRRTRGRVVTRFPPEPNGDLHIGHAKAINLNFEYARKYGGYTYLRYDDTNPRNESKEYFDSILEDVRWLGFEPHKITASSDYFYKMIEFSIKLIRKGKAYVCHLDTDEIRRRRREYQDAEDGDCSILSPHRNRSVEENLKTFEEVLSGEWEEGKACLRFKMETESKNPLMLDLVGARVINARHPRSGIKYPIYPSYEFALCVSDSLEDVTHSFCTREFYTRQESYNWLLDQLEIYKPVQWEFSRLNVSNTVLSKRKLLQLAKYGIGLDDPRLYTIKGMRRRGFTPNAINAFCRSVGLTFSETTVDVRILENFVRDDLNRIARRVMCVRDPLRVTIMNAKPHRISVPDLPGSGTAREIGFTPTIFIERSDFMEEGDEDFLRLTPENPVGLCMLFPIRVVRVSGDGILAERCDDVVPKKHIHWVSEENVKVEMRMYSPLWDSFNPEEGDYLSEMSKNSLEICGGLCDTRILDAHVGERLQFQRIGYFCVDRDTTENRIVVNLTIPLKGAA
jgi:glutaminyl-tRNA synthetase